MSAATPAADTADAPSSGRVSVIMPAWNAAATIGRSIDSVLSQDHADLELVVVDDGSTDATAELVARRAATDARVRLLRQANAGVAAARNAGMAAASGRYLAFLDSDDWWYPGKLRRQLACMRDTGAAVSYSAYERFATDGRRLSQVTPPASVTHADMLRSNRIGNLTGMLDRRLGDLRFEHIGHEDYVFWLRAVRLAGTAIRVGDGEPLAGYLVRDGSVSANKWRAARWQWRIYRDVERLAVLPAAGYMLAYGVNALRKRR